MKIRFIVFYIGIEFTQRIGMLSRVALDAVFAVHDAASTNNRRHSSYVQMRGKWDA